MRSQSTGSTPTTTGRREVHPQRRAEGQVQPGTAREATRRRPGEGGALEDRRGAEPAGARASREGSRRLGVVHLRQLAGVALVASR